MNHPAARQACSVTHDPLAAPAGPPADLPDLHNLRDVGGLRTDDGGRTRHGVLYRSGTVAFLDAAQAEVLVGDDGLGVRCRVDLRGPREVAEETSAALRERERRAEHVEIHAADVAWDFTASHRSDWVAAHYARYLDASGDRIVTVARLLADPANRPLLAHCSAGKDRTGVTVAVLLRAVGVTADDLVADYARTAQAIAGLREQLTRLPAYGDRIAAVPQEALGSTPETMWAFLSTLEERHGGARAYLLGHGLDGSELSALSEALVEPA